MKVICPICNKEYSSLMIHVKRSHKLSQEELLQKYPGTKLISEELSAKKSEIMSKRNSENWNNPEYREKHLELNRQNGLKTGNSEENKKRMSNLAENISSEQRSKMVSNRNKTCWNNEEYRNKMHNVCSKANAVMREKNFEKLREVSSQTMKNNWNSKEFRLKMKEVSSKTMSNTMNKLWNENYDEMHDIVCESNSERGFNHYEYNGNDYNSTWEVYFQKICDKNSIKCERNQRQYEFKYSFDGHIRTYRPDFYLPDLDLFVEIKANYLVDAKVIAKLNCVKELGREIYIITEDHLWDDDLLDKITNKTYSFQCK